MTKTEILTELQRLPASEQLLILESLEHQLRERLKTRPAKLSTGGDLAAAAKALLSNYESDPELTAFTALDGEQIHETR